MRSILALLFIGFSLPAFAANDVVDNLEAKHQKIRLDGLTQCLKDGTKAIQGGGDWDNDACFENIMTFEKKTDDFNDKVSLVSRITATDATGNIYPIHLSVTCTDQSILVSVLTKHAYGGQKSAEVQYRVGKRVAKSITALQFYGNGYVGFGLMSPDEINFMRDVAEGGNDDVLFKIRADDMTTFTARFDAKNMAGAAADALRVCPELQKTQSQNP